jgi:hypothetical protein
LGEGILFKISSGKKAHDRGRLTMNVLGSRKALSLDVLLRR